MKLDPLLSLALTMHSSKGVYALLLGSGVSRAAAIPTGWEVVLDLIRRVAKAQQADCEPDPAAWFKTTHEADLDYSKLLDMLAPTPELRQQLLRGYFEPTDQEREDGLKQPTKAHRAIARMVARGYVKVVLTTNFDRLTERAIEDEGVVPVVVSTPAALEGCLPLVHQHCTVIKLHGDYLDTRIKNTPDELAAYDPSLDAMLDRVVDEFGLIIAGWSADWDVALRAAIERCKNRRFGFYFTAVREPSEKAKTLVTARAGTIVPITDADSFFDELATKLEVLEDAKTDHPVNVQTAVALVKRYAARPEHRIRLYDLLTREADLVFAESESLEKAWRADHSNQKHLKLIKALTESTAKLRRMLAHAAHWGGDDVIRPAIQCIARLARDPLPPNQNGVLRNDWIRYFLGGVVLYSTGVGYVTSGNYAAAAKLLRDAYSDGVNRREQFVIAFTYGRENVAAALNDGRKDKQLVPFSELMHAQLGDELRELSSGPAAFEASFDEWELLVAFIFGELQHVKYDAERGSWITPGRYVWRMRYELRSPLFPSPRDPDSIEQCQAQRPFNELVGAGFFGGKWERVLELRKILLQVASHHRWG